ncbi:YqkE family protein [Paenibacillus sp. GSMTC-2017]|uniref:YqkE family protein n=1 Tax=Paenibacillus sp. GSMTC-2017 TaxID=2794350 RepID=UPI0018D924CD|nr:YqkE family protein [Paenibacillus sp. GSMTC-2017]MBH5317887.1 YqkE family protein [Paenibacillus sp. GSMTC-2017]
MAKKRKVAKPPKKSDSGSDQEKGVTLKELLGADVLSKLKAQADELKKAEQDQKELVLKQEEEVKKKEQKLKENDFAYLLENSNAGWNKYK